MPTKLGFLGIPAGALSPEDAQESSSSSLSESSSSSVSESSSSSVPSSESSSVSESSSSSVPSSESSSSSSSVPSEPSSSSSESSSSSLCEVLEFVPHGRQGIGVVQPQSGTNFPLVLPSEDVRHLLADLNLTFDQPSDYADVPAYEGPFYIYWLSGFGCDDIDLTPGRGIIPPDEAPASSSSVSVSSSSSVSSVSVSSSSSSSSVPGFNQYLPTATNGHDIIIIDKVGRIVFDSTLPAVTYETRVWTDRLTVVMWRHPILGNVNLSYHTKWSPDETPTPRVYPTYFFPANAHLDERSVQRLPKRLRSVTVVLDNFTNNGLEFINGYNMEITREDTQEIDGTRRTTQINFDATAGGGLGIFPGCDPEPLVIRTINGVGPTTERGDFYLTATDCLWIRQPTTLLAETPLRLTLPNTGISPGNIPTAGLPDPDAGTAKNLPGWPTDDDEIYAHLQIGSDCDACCDCDDYVTVANYLNDTRDQYQELGRALKIAQDFYHENRERWLNQAFCVVNRPLRIRLLPQLCPYIDIAIQYCNQSGECQTNVELEVVFTTSPGGGVGTPVPGFTFITGATRKPGRIAPRTERYDFGGSYPGPLTFFFDAVGPFQSVTGRLRLQYNDCGLTGGVPYAITGCLTGTIDGTPIENIPAIGQPLTVVEVCETATLNCPIPDGDVTFNPLLCDVCE